MDCKDEIRLVISKEALQFLQGFQRYIISFDFFVAVWPERDDYRVI